MPSTERTSRTLWTLMYGHRRRYAAALLAMFAGVGLLYVTPLITRAAIDGVLVTGVPTARLSVPARFLADRRDRWGAGPALTAAAAAALAVTVAAATLTSLQGRLSGVASEAIVRALRDRLARHLQHVPMTWHDTAQTGDVVQRCTSDVDTVRLFYREQVVQIASSSARIAVGLPVLLAIDWRMGLAATGLMPVIILFAAVFFRRVQGSFKKADEAEGAMTAALQENLTGIRVVRAFARQGYEVERFTARNGEHRDRSRRLFTVMAVYWSTSDLLCMAQFAAVVLIGGWRASRGTMTVGTMVAFVAYAQLFIWPVREVGRVLTELGKTLVAVGRIREVLDVPEEPLPATVATLPANVRGAIELSHVGFSHNGKPVLTDVSLSVPAGTTLGLIGPSGAGKSTLVNLLLRLYDDYAGTITLDGVDIKSVDRKAVRGQFGVVLQEPFLYSKSLRENVKLGRHTAADDEMFAAAQAAAIHESITSFTAGYDTLIGERGVTLSGGQRQRTAVARALLTDAPVVVMDDALSAVDTGTEGTILDGVRRRRGRRTTVLIAHRLSTLMHADQIAVLEGGRVTQRGTHDELVEQDGLYRRLWRIQGMLAEDLRADLGEESDELAAVSAAEERA